jgi:hypothetical protein
VLDTPTVQLPPSPEIVSVSATISGLAPDAEYDATLFASNAEAERSNPGGEFVTSKPPKPLLRAGALRPTARAIKLGSFLSFSGVIKGPIGLYTKYYPAPQAHLLHSRAIRPAFGVTISPIKANGRVHFTDVEPYQNTEFRLRIGHSVSRPVRVIVYPATSLTVTRDTRDPRYVIINYALQAHTPPRGYHPPHAYFYFGTSRNGPFRLVASRRLHQLNGDFYAHPRVLELRGGTYVACIPRQLIPTMGRPFTDHHCGRSTLQLTKRPGPGRS